MRSSKKILPCIPDKNYFSISEAARLCLVESHVLRFWEAEFPPFRPEKRKGNRRYYRPEDIKIAREIRHLLYEEGFTISGARQQLRTFKKQLKQEKSWQNLKEILQEAVVQLGQISKMLSGA